jgi:hypothetical protein
MASKNFFMTETKRKKKIQKEIQKQNLKKFKKFKKELLTSEDAFITKTKRVNQ